MSRPRWLAAIAALAAFDVWCFLAHWSAVAGNVAASIIWATPALAVHHVAIRRRQDAQHVERMAAHAELVGRQEAHAQALATVTAQVGELHEFHIEGRLPERITKP